ncbi:hypothetical protein ABK040_002140 [Willaertia magna]
MPQNIYSVNRGIFTNLNFPQIKEIASGSNTVLILTIGGDVYFRGDFNDDAIEEEFTKLDIPTKIEKIGCGEIFGLLLDESNQVFIRGAIGHNKYNDFTKICNIKESIKFISCGADLVVLITKNNELLLFGSYEALTGIDRFVEEDNFQKLNILPKNVGNIKDLQFGYYHSILLDDLGNIYGGGKYERKRIGIDLKEFTKINVNFKVKQIATYSGGTLLLNYNNELFGCGENSYNQLNHNGDIEYIEEFTKIDINENLIIKKLFFSGYTCNIILTNDGFYVVGDNECFSQQLTTIFTKLNYNYNNNYKYKTAIMGFRQLFIIESDNKINDKRVKNKKIYNKLYLQQCNNDNPFIDITFQIMSTSW